MKAIPNVSADNITVVSTFTTWHVTMNERLIVTESKGKVIHEEPLLTSLNVRFGSLADIGSRPRHIRLPPKADIGRCNWNVR